MSHDMLAIPFVITNFIFLFWQFETLENKLRHTVSHFVDVCHVLTLVPLKTCIQYLNVYISLSKIVLFKISAFKVVFFFFYEDTLHVHCNFVNFVISNKTL